MQLEIPMVYLVDSAGARITEQVQMFPGRRGAGRIFHNQVKLSGVVPQVCVLFGPSAAGGAYIPAFCDIVIMREGNASMYLGSPRMAEMVIGEKVTLEEMGGARMHTGVSGCGHQLVKSDEEGIATARRYLSYLPGNWREEPPAAPRRAARGARTGGPHRRADPGRREQAVRHQGADRGARRRGLAAGDPPALGEGARRRLRAAGRPGDRDRRQPAEAQGRRAVLATPPTRPRASSGRCNAFNVPLLFLADVPGFMIGTQVEREGIIRHGAKMISAVSEATVPKISVIVRKAYGAGLYAMAGPGLRARLLHRAAERVDRGDGPAGGDQRRLLQPAAGDRGRPTSAPPRPSELRARVRRGHRHPAPRLRARDRRGDRARALRGELIRRFAHARGKRREWPAKHNPVTPV